MAGFTISKSTRVEMASGAVAALEEQVTKNGKPTVLVTFESGESMVFPHPSVWDYTMDIAPGSVITATWSQGKFAVAEGIVDPAASLDSDEAPF